MNDKIKVEDIDASLTCTLLFTSKAWKIFFVIAYIVLGIWAICGVIAIILIPVNSGEFNDDVIAAICMLGISCISIIGVLLARISTQRDENKVKLWIQDAVILDAHAKFLRDKFVDGKTFLIETAIEVTFEYNNKQITRKSVSKDDLLYSVAYTKYADKDITIAYSQKYDEVMLIKPSHVSRIRGD